MSSQKHTTKQTQQTQYTQHTQHTQHSRMLKVIPMDRDTEQKGAPPLVVGAQQSNAKRIMRKTGTKIRFLSNKEQRALRHTGLEVNYRDARVLSIEADPDAESPNVELACKMVASAVEYWRELLHPEQSTGPGPRHNSGPEQSPESNSGQEPSPENNTGEPE